jgi:hypothetical protein
MGTVKIEVEVAKAENGYVVKFDDRIFIAPRQYDFDDIFEREGRRIYDTLEATTEKTDDQEG